jgi:hypothetical protein
MDIQIIQDHVPLRRLRIAGNQALEMSYSIMDVSQPQCTSDDAFDRFPNNGVI